MGQCREAVYFTYAPADVAIWVEAKHTNVRAADVGDVAVVGRSSADAARVVVDEAPATRQGRAIAALVAPPRVKEHVIVMMVG